MRMTRLLPVLAIATLFPANFAWATGALLAHRAVYDLDLGEASERSGVVGIAGRIVYEFKGSPCEGYSTNYRFVSRMNLGETQRMNDYRIVTFEKGDGTGFDFESEFFIDDRLDKATRGSAAKGGDRLDVTLEAPAAGSVTLDASHFPTQHMVELIGKAQAGENFYETSIFDGSDGGDKVMTTTVVIGKLTSPNGNDPELPAMEPLAKDGYWPVSMAYFDMSKQDGDEVPTYAIRFKLHENGFMRDLYMDYGDFSMKGRLVQLKVLDQPQTCEPK